MRKPLTPRQAQVVDVIRMMTKENGFPPTIRDLCEKLGTRSTNGVVCHLHALKKKGWIEWNKFKARSVRLKGSMEDEKGKARDARIQVLVLQMLEDVTSHILSPEEIDKAYPNRDDWNGDVGVRVNDINKWKQALTKIYEELVDGDEAKAQAGSSVEARDDLQARRNAVP